MKKFLILAPVFFAGICLLASFTMEKYATADVSDIEQTILKAYIHGAFNELNPEAMAAGFHEDFAIFSADGEAISKYPIAQWVEGVKKRKSSADFDAAKNKWDHRFSIVDKTGGSAIAKVELSKDGRHVYTDYLSLLKFDSGWKIVAKVYHQHKE